MSTCGFIVMSRSSRLPAANNSSRSRPEQWIGAENLFGGIGRGGVFEFRLSLCIGRREAILSRIFVGRLDPGGADFRHIFTGLAGSFGGHRRSPLGLHSLYVIRIPVATGSA